MNKQKGNTSVTVSFIIVIVIVGLVIYALMRKADVATVIPEGRQNAISKQVVDTRAPEEKPQPSIKSMAPKTLEKFTPVKNVAKLEKIDLVVGTGAEVKTGDTVSVHYTGAVAATGAVFQSSKEFGTTPITFPLDRVIKGWTDGIPGMKIGGTRRLVIPAAQAYGATPPAGSGIPANADLVFDVELVAIQ